MPRLVPRTELGEPTAYRTPQRGTAGSFVLPGGRIGLVRRHAMMRIREVGTLGALD